MIDKKHMYVFLTVLYEKWRIFDKPTNSYVVGFLKFKMQYSISV